MSSLGDETAVYKDQLDRWIETLGLPQHQPANNEVETILGFTRDTMRERSSVQLSEDAIILAQYALFMQQKANECQTFIKWSNQVMNRLLGDDRPRLNQWVRQAELRLERIQYLARRIELVGQSISGLVRSRYNEGSNR
ncbi:MAG: hypothetical protein DRJ03_00235 [Chloroflexi bacterium]|nr:MAG: hypothetical protein DRJ03_00235 [Chloroflexota bacterium]